MTMRGTESAARSSSLSRLPTSKSMINIDDFPDDLVVEILCRLPRESAVQCKFVSRYWFTLISSRRFHPRFLHLQTPTILFHAEHRSRIKNKTKWETFSISLEPDPGPFNTVVRRFFLLSFLPLGEEPVIIATYNDLVLCCATLLYQRDYYICNPYTKQWIALPPTPHCHRSVLVGFICDKVVRIPKVGDKSLQFEIEMFSLESGEWRELVVSSPQGLTFDFHGSWDVGVAYNGMLYWVDCGGCLFRLDPSINNVNTTSIGDHIIDHEKYCCVINKPGDGSGIIMSFSVFQGCLRMCQYWILEGCSDIRQRATLRVWELKEEVDGGKLKLKWFLTNCVCLFQLALENPIVGEWVKIHGWSFRVLGFDLEGNHLYLGIDGDIFMWNIPTKTSTMIYQRKRPDSDVCHCHLIDGFSFVLPWCPTPVLPLLSHTGS